MRNWRPWAETFVLVAAWDWLATLSVRYIGNDSLWAVPLAVAITGFWWVAAKRAQQPGTLLPALVGAAAGTLLGLKLL